MNKGNDCFKESKNFYSLTFHFLCPFSASCTIYLKKTFWGGGGGEGSVFFLK